MTFNPKIHNRRGIRLKTFDYSQPGAYFMTVSCQNGSRLFGEIISNKMILNDAGKLIEKWYFEMEHKYPNLRCETHVVMPNHFRCIVRIVDCEEDRFKQNSCENTNVGMSLCGCPPLINPDVEREKMKESRYGPDNIRDNASVLEMMGWFKTMTTNEYIRGVKKFGWPRFNRKLWQRSFYEKIIWNKKAYGNITQYIKNNPVKWDEKYNSKEK